MTFPVTYPIPDQTPSDEPLIVIFVNEQWFSFLYGAIEQFATPDVWQGTPAQQDDAVQKVYEMMEYLTGAATMNAVTNIRWNNGNLEFEQNGEWVSLLDMFLCNCPDLFPQADQPAGEATDQADFVCAGVFQSIDYMVNLYTDLLDEAQLVLDAAQGIRDAVLNFLEVLSGGVLELAPVDEIHSAIKSLEQAELDSRTGQINSLANQEAWQEYLYCAIRDNSNVLTKAIFDDWVTNSIAPTNPPGLIAADLDDFCTDIMTWERFKSRYILYSNDEQNDCRLLGWCDEEWTVVFNFEDGQHGFTPLNIGGIDRAVYEAGSGYRHWDTENEPGKYYFCQVSFGAHDAFYCKSVKIVTSQTQTTAKWQLRTVGANHDQIENGVAMKLLTVEAPLSANDLDWCGLDCDPNTVAGHFGSLQIRGTGAVPSQWSDFLV